MNIRRLILYVVFVAYQAGAFMFTYMVDGHLDLLGLLKFIPWFKYISFLGMVLILVDIIWFIAEQRANKRERNTLKEANEELKAKLSQIKNNPGSTPV
ncbi:MAG: hypothetical protein SH819_13040 [Cytophagales bacterium]|nr:hypothetical protein [Cytophagales bacterium]